MTDSGLFVLILVTFEIKALYLRGLYEVTCLRDVIERNYLCNPKWLKQLVRVLASGKRFLLEQG